MVICALLFLLIVAVSYCGGGGGAVMWSLASSLEHMERNTVMISSG
jgi:hypothetical protein